MAEAYLWVKVVHLLAVISWMAGLFYLPRLFVYHAESSADSPIRETFKVMERRLLAAIMRPAAVVVAVSGIALIYTGNWFGPVPWWLWAKLGFVVLMFGYHGVLKRHARRFREDAETCGGRYFRVLNEVPTVLLIGIVILVVVKPF